MCYLFFFFLQEWMQKKKVILWLTFIFGFKHWYLLNNTYNTFHTDNAKLFGNIIACTHVCIRIPALSSPRRWIKPKYWVAKSLKPPSQKYLWWILFHEMPPWSSTHTNYCCKVNNSRKTWLVERIPWDVNWPPSQKVNADWGMHGEKKRVGQQRQLAVCFLVCLSVRDKLNYIYMKAVWTYVCESASHSYHSAKITTLFLIFWKLDRAAVWYTS